MNVNLLYSYKDWMPVKQYIDWQGMVKDLGLESLFQAAAQDSVIRNSRVVYAEHQDNFLAQSMRRVMCVPLQSREEVLYRQEILKDCLRHEDFIGRLYVLATQVLEDWEKLGKTKNHTGVRDTKAELITDIEVLRLLVAGMGKVRNLLLENMDGLHSKGFMTLLERINLEFSGDAQQNIEKILGDITFYADATLQRGRRGVFTLNKPLIQIDCGLMDGFKLGDLKLEKIETKVEDYSNPYGIKAKLQGRMNGIVPQSISLYKNTALQADAAEFEYQAVSYVMACCSGVLQSFGSFFEQLRFQVGFYLGAINIWHQMKRFQLEDCFPEVGGQEDLSYEELKEIVMTISRGKSGNVYAHIKVGLEKTEWESADQNKNVVMNTVGNTGNLDGKLLTIITGANQGGKSTFLRSIGIAQVMMQCGLMVAAKRYKSGLYPSFFTHFTRREDSAMNSGRLDEELKRMDKIISNLEERSLILLNESFATTTEKEGSAIAYDIIKALGEQNVRIITVTHLLSFAQRLYEETKQGDDTAFLSAERLGDGSRTFRMIPHAPEMTSFGLELFEEVLGNV